MISIRSRTTWALLIVEGVLSGTYWTVRFRSTSFLIIKVVADEFNKWTSIMFLDAFEEYNSQYEKGIKKISFRSYRPKIVNEKLPLKMEQSFGNYDLFFSKEGVLLQSVHTEKDENCKIIYGYDNKKRIVSSIKLSSLKNKLLGISEFTYDEKGRIKTGKCRSFYYSLNSENVTERIHTYLENKEEIFMISNDEFEDEYRFYLTFDYKNRLIEDKTIRNEDELVYWYKNEYAQEGNLVKQISLNENGDPEGIYEFMPLKNGMETGYKYSSKDNKYLREYVYELNEKGAWINQVMMNDGELMYSYEEQ